jgi:hypothetical protein
MTVRVSINGGPENVLSDDLHHDRQDFSSLSGRDLRDLEDRIALVAEVEARRKREFFDHLRSGRTPAARAFRRAAWQVDVDAELARWGRAGW